MSNTEIGGRVTEGRRQTDSVTALTKPRDVAARASRERAEIYCCSDGEIRRCREHLASITAPWQDHLSVGWSPSCPRALPSP